MLQVRAVVQIEYWMITIQYCAEDTCSTQRPLQELDRAQLLPSSVCR